MPVKKQMEEFQAEKDKESANRLLALMDQNADRKLDVKEVHAFANINSKVPPPYFYKMRKLVAIQPS